MTAPVDPKAFRTVMGRWATGVTVVTAHDGDADAGMTVNAFLSVALEPPSVLVSLQRDADTLPLIERSGRFALSVLAADQRALSEQFARPTPSAEKFRGVGVHRGATGAPLLDGTIGGLECEVRSVVPAFDHRLVIGEVVGIDPGRDALPLLFFRSGYAVAEDGERVRLPPPRPPAGTR